MFLCKREALKGSVSGKDLTIQPRSTVAGQGPRNVSILRSFPWGGSVSLTSRREDTVRLQTLWGQGVGGSRWPGPSQCSCPTFCLCAPVKPLWPRYFRPWNSFCSMAWEIGSHSWEEAESDLAVLCSCSGLITGLHQYLVPASPEPPGLVGVWPSFSFVLRILHPLCIHYHSCTSFLCLKKKGWTPFINSPFSFVLKGLYLFLLIWVGHLEGLEINSYV